MLNIVMKSAVPETSRILANLERKVDYVDSFSVVLPLGERFSVDYLLATVFSCSTWWMDALLVFRNAVVAAFGLRTGPLSVATPVSPEVRFEPGNGDCLFTVIDRTDDEIVMAEGDKHLDFRASLKKTEVADHLTRIEFTTVVFYNNWLGPLYFTFVKPFHRRMMKSMMARASVRLRNDVSKGGARD
jgi:hypothetical protein